jgi:sulfotransferase
MEKTLNLIVGLPRAGSSVITKILSQNTAIYTEIESPVFSLLNFVQNEWRTTDSDEKKRTLKGMIEGFYSKTENSVIFDNNIRWLPLLPQLEEVLEKDIKLLVCVRNPAEIITSFERSRKANPLIVSEADQALKHQSSIAGRAYYYAGPEGILGKTYQQLKDSITAGYLDRMLFVDYGMYCNSPKSQTKRIYEFFEMEKFDHDFNNIPNNNRKELEKTVVNSVQYIGLDLYEQYNREIFWNAWV